LLQLLVQHALARGASQQIKSTSQSCKRKEWVDYKGRLLVAFARGHHRISQGMQSLLPNTINQKTDRPTVCFEFSALV
jgi:hypothetical protein